MGLSSKTRPRFLSTARRSEGPSRRARGLSPVEFRYYNDKLAKKPKLSVDGIVPVSLHFSHFKGNKTPPRYKADTGTEIAIKVAEDSSFDRNRVPICTNNHYDTDGVLAVWAMCFPEDAVLTKEVAIKAAETGDFNHYSTDEAFKVDAAIEGYRHAPSSPYAATIAGLDQAAADGYVYQKLSHMFPDLWQDIERHKSLWEKPLEEVNRHFDAFRSKQFAVKELWDDWLTVVEGPFAPHPVAVDRFCQGRVFLLATPGPLKKGSTFEVDYAYWSWADTVQREKVEWVDFGPLAETLNQKDKGDGKWLTHWQGQGDTAVLRYAKETGKGADSAVSAADLTEALRHHLKTGKKVAPPAPAPEPAA